MVFDDFGEELLPSGPITLGVLGSWSSITKTDLHEKILHPLLEHLGRLPDTIALPSEGESSVWISVWAERQDIPFQMLHADWKKLGRRARALRDARILKEGTHLLIFQGARSDAYEKIAVREVLRGKKVFVVHPKTMQIEQYVAEM